MTEVDMSPEAVAARLRMVDDLWLLSVKLMNSKKIGSAGDSKENGLSDNASDQSAAGKETGI